MSHKPQLRVPAVYMRGGTSKGVFFLLQDLPPAAQQAGPQRDKFLLRVIGSPDPYGKHIDGMGGATSSTSKVVILSPSQNKEFDVNYLFGQVAIEEAFIDWGGNCGNLSAAVGPFAIYKGLIARDKIPQNGICTVKIWQENIKKPIIAHVPISNGEVQETGDFYLDGVAFPAAEIALEFVDPSEEGALFPTGKVKEKLEVPGVGSFEVTLIQSGIPTVFLKAEELGYQGTELQPDINNNPNELERLEKIRSYAAVQMGIIQNPEEAKKSQHVPKIAWVSPPKSYLASSGKEVSQSQVDLLVRAMSMGKLHHAMMGTAAVAIGTAAAIEGTVVCEAMGGTPKEVVVFGHPSGTLRVGAKAELVNGEWRVRKALMSRSARILMEGWIRVPQD
ncbi:MAG: 2-methylaconitate cis-trans isomerase PrpF [Leptospiraceae bacterium]|nr:2-methylaconitate cis-trans isomerase PrpF [Leptospiraceae bacterium]MDW8307242.1 2-methylaconitate cis-trans isomerase PrpF [Leptospiraceae bacterium]